MHANPLCDRIRHSWPCPDDQLHHALLLAAVAPCTGTILLVSAELLQATVPGPEAPGVGEPRIQLRKCVQLAGWCRHDPVLRPHSSLRSGEDGARRRFELRLLHTALRGPLAAIAARAPRSLPLRHSGQLLHPRTQSGDSVCWHCGSGLVLCPGLRPAPRLRSADGRGGGGKTDLSNATPRVLGAGDGSPVGGERVPAAGGGLAQAGADRVQGRQCALLPEPEHGLAQREHIDRVGHAGGCLRPKWKREDHLPQGPLPIVGHIPQRWIRGSWPGQHPLRWR
mmetsp:Transcript_30637/g.84502  ORF Transcript_30637/g.84502 Transcript_30637/m.84502 type:complete len:281 (-) Transcript_30637:1326-2168(-)